MYPILITVFLSLCTFTPQSVHTTENVGSSVAYTNGSICNWGTWTHLPGHGSHWSKYSNVQGTFLVNLNNKYEDDRVCTYLEIKSGVNGTLPSPRHLGISSDGYVFELVDGSGVKAGDIRNIEHLASLLPLIKEVNTNEFLNWIKAVDQDTRRQILQTVRGLPLGENSAELVEKLYHFIDIEKQISTMNNVVLRINSGEFFTDMTKMTKDVAESIALSRKVWQRSILALGLSFLEPAARNRSTTALGPRNEEGIIWSPAGIGKIRSLNQLSLDSMNGLMMSDDDVTTALVGMLVGQVIGRDEMMLMTQDDMIKIIMAFLAAFKTPEFKMMFDTSVVMLGAFCPPCGLYFGFQAIGMDIHDLATGNLSGIELGLKITSLVLNVLGIIVTAVGMAFPAFYPLIVTKFGAFLGMLNSFLPAIIGWFTKGSRDKAANSAVDSLNYYITLTPAERERALKQAQNGQEFDKYLIDLAKQRGANDALLDSSLKFLLTNNTEFERYVFPAFNAPYGGGDNDKFDFYLNNVAILNTNKATYDVARWTPFPGKRPICVESVGLQFLNDPLECVPTGTPSQEKRTGYKCVNAMGIVYSGNHLINHRTLIDFKDGDDQAYGTEEFENVFMVEAGRKDFLGGNKNDTFVLLSNRSTGRLNGFRGNNTLAISGTNVTDPQINVNLQSKTVTFGGNPGTSLGIENMAVVSGRENMSDIITAACETIAIIGGGGSSSLVDQIIIPDTNCEYDLFIEGARRTKISSAATLGNFVYKLPSDADVTFFFENHEEASHTVFLDFDVEDFKMIRAGDKNELVIESKLATSTFQLSDLLPDDTFHAKPVFLTRDNATVRLDSKKVVSVIYNLTNPVASVEAVKFGQSIFFIDASVGKISGWDGNDTFTILSESFRGELDGGGGVNHLMLDNDIYPNSEIHVDMAGFVKIGGNRITEFKNIRQSTGREKERDIFTCVCDTLFINTRGSVSGKEDIVNIPRNDSCTYETAIRLGGHGRVSNLATKGSFVYMIPFEEMIGFELTYKENLTHVIAFEFATKYILNGSVADNTTFTLIGPDSTEIFLPIFRDPGFDPETDANIAFFDGPTYVTNDTAVMKIRHDGVFNFIFNITEPKLLTEGSGFGENIFFLYNKSDIVGGGETDLFILYGMDYSGQIDGAGGSKDKLILDETFYEGQPIELDLSERDDTLAIVLKNIEEVVGRNQSQDTIICGCGTSLVDGVQGFSTSPDVIVIPDMDCPFEVVIIFRNDTEIRNEAKNGSFIYSIVETEGQFDFVSGTHPDLIHTVRLPYFQPNLTNVTFDPEQNTLNFHTKWNTIGTFKLTELGEEDAYYPRPGFLNNDWIEFKVGKDGHPSALFQVVNDTIGFPWLRNVFFVENVTVDVTGGDLDDIFIIKNSNMSVQLFGLNGSNTLIILDQVEGPVTVSHNLINADGATNIVYNNMTTILGRNGSADFITADCNVRMIASKGGLSEEDQDKILIPNLPSCNYTERMNIAIDGFTKVTNEANNGYFHYSVLNPNASFHLQCTDCINATHVFAMNFTTESIRSIEVNKTSGCSLTVGTTDHGSVDFSIKDSYPCVFPNLLIGEDSLEISVSWIGSIRGNVLSFQNESVEALMVKWVPVATRLNMTITVLKNETQEMVAMSRNGFDMLWTSPTHRTTLVGNKGMNIHVIGEGWEGYTPEVDIYSVANSSDIIDLSWLVKPIRKGVGALKKEIYVPEVNQVDKDLVIKIEDSYTSLPALITLKNYTNFYLNTTLLLNQNPMSLKMAGDGWILAPIPIPFNKQSLIIMDQDSFEEKTQVVIDKPMTGKNTVMHSGNDLVVTNVFNSSKEEFFTLVFDGFFETNAAGALTRNTAQQHPADITLSIGSDGKEIYLDEILASDVDDLMGVLIEEKENLELEVFGFVCKEAGKFMDPRSCNVYYECTLVGDGKFVQYEFTCPTGTVYCTDSQQCGYESNCPCPVSAA